MSDKSVAQAEGLSKKQIKHLKGLAHPLSPVVQVGKEGLTEAVMDTIRTELIHHELIKVKIGNNSGIDKKEASEIVPQQSESELVQLIGKTLILFKANKKKQKDKRIYLPKG